MLSRRLIRVKVFQWLYAYWQQHENSIPNVLKQLDRSMRGMYDMYLFMLQMPLHFRSYLDSEKDAEAGKYFPSKENIRLAAVLDNNEVLNHLERDEQFALRTKKLPYNWQAHGEVFEKLFSELKQEPFFQDYMVFDKPDAAQQKEFLLDFYHYCYTTNELVIHELEEIYSGWQDDDAALVKAVIKTIDSHSDDKSMKLSVLSANESDDISYARLLFEKAITEKETIDELVSSNAPNWDTERIALSDMILIQMAVCEFLFFKEIPVKVTINEYLDIAKEYSTPKSNLFLNGVLDKIRIKLTEQGRVVKSGRGLRDN